MTGTQKKNCHSKCIEMLFKVKLKKKKSKKRQIEIQPDKIKAIIQHTSMNWRNT